MHNFTTYNTYSAAEQQRKALATECSNMDIYYGIHIVSAHAEDMPVYTIAEHNVLTQAVVRYL